MPKRKSGEFDFTIWFEDGSRCQWKSRRPTGTNADVANAIRRYLVPFMERYETPQSAVAVDPVATTSVDPPTRV